MIPNPYIEVHTSPVDRRSVPPWFAEAVIMVQRLATKELLDVFAYQVRLVRGHFGSYELRRGFPTHQLLLHSCKPLHPGTLLLTQQFPQGEQIPPACR